MKAPSRQAALWLAVVSALALILLALAALQIHWTDQVSQADRERLRANLDTSVTRFQRDFYLQLLRVCWAFRIAGPESVTAAMDAYAGRYDDWRNASAYPAMIGGLLLWDQQHARLFRLNPSTEQFELTSWPPELLKLRHNLRKLTSASSPEDVPGPRWILDEQTYSLIHPLRIGQQSYPARHTATIVVRLSPEFLWHRLAPQLTARYFGSRYAVAIVGRADPLRPLFESVSPAPGRPLANGDIVANLVPGTEEDLFDPVANPEHARGDPARAEQKFLDGAGPGGGRRYFSLARFAAAGQRWELVVRGTSGTVEAAVRALHRRNLTIGFGVLLLLAVAMSLVVISAQTAQRLARTQMNFLAGISHELRTPLTVICSAADNLADGMLAGSDRVKDYGNLIRDQGRRLSHMVNEVLSFAAGRAVRRFHRQEPVDPSGIIETVLANLQAEIESQHVTVEKNVEQNLPLVWGDPSALAECIQNLVSNAIRYGGEARWMRIQAGRRHSHGKEEVVVMVEDRGPGISPRDLRRIFEPFYRGANATDAQIHGTGLGLSIAQQAAKAMGGRLTVRSAVGKGSQFTLALPALASADSET